MVGDRQLDREAKESAAVSYRKARKIPADKLNAKPSVHRRIRRRNRWDEGPWVIRGRTRISRSGVGISGGGGQTKEGFLPLWHIERHSKDIANERKDGEGEYAPSAHGTSEHRLMKQRRRGGVIGLSIGYRLG